jgi:hypothetical protein
MLSVYASTIQENGRKVLDQGKEGGGSEACTMEEDKWPMCTITVLKLENECGGGRMSADWLINFVT